MVEHFPNQKHQEAMPVKEQPPMKMDKLFDVYAEERGALKRKDISRGDEFARRRQEFFNDARKRYQDPENRESVLKGFEQGVMRGMSNEDVHLAIEIVGGEEMNHIVKNVLDSMGMDEQWTLVMDTGEEVQVSENPVDYDKDFSQYIIRYHLKGSHVGKVAPISSFISHIRRER